MKLLVIQKAPRPDGGTTQTKKAVSAEWVRVGRNASCEIHLPDPRIALEQGMIVNRGGPVYIEGEAGSTEITRKTVRSVRLKRGEVVDIGPYALQALETPAGFDAAISVELVRPLESAPVPSTRTTPRSLASLGMSKRATAWAGLVAILIGFLLIPAGRVLHLPWSGNDRIWNPGPVILSHQPIEERCSACHEAAFQHVKDESCLECHSKIGQHVGPALHPAALFEGLRCASCHREHKGAKAFHKDSDGFCVDCHRDIHARSPEAKVKDVSDFAKGHPAFAMPATDNPHLAFPHQKHLDPRGIKSPSKGRVKLECANCHHPDASKRMFEPISMAKDCQECHRLEIEPAVTTREVPHGKTADAVAMIDEFYASLALRGVPDSFQKAFGVPGEGLLRRVGEPTPAERESALRLASRKAREVAIDLVEVRTCKTCHEVSRDTQEKNARLPSWTIAQPRTSKRWMPGATFDHASHAQSKCADCHDVANSKRSSDVSMPKIEACRECHGGSKAQTGKVTSSCMLCHGFHDERHPWNPDFRPRGGDRVAGADPRER
ncbi:MAG TPA: cytochrome c3 family protein [Usitatibacter sp.]|nr:cytochrome c3 family protein [Usitatibacter sp.]